MDRSTMHKFKSSLSGLPLYKTWSTRFGDDIIPFFGAASGFYITHYFRKQFKIRPYAPWTCYTPVMAISGVVIDMMNTCFTNGSIMSGDPCAPCICTRAGLMQVTLGVGYPLLIAPIITLYTADRLITYPVPSLTQAPKEVMNLVWKLMRQNSHRFLIAAGIQFTGAFLLTWHKHNFLKKFVEGQQLH